MAAPSGQLKASRYFIALALILVALYSLVFFTGDKKPHPKLGLDLQGGTSLTLLASNLTGGKAPDKDRLERAREIISERVDQTGVSSPDVVTAGNDQIVVSVAGKSNQDQMRKLVAPAELRFRRVLKSTSGAGDNDPGADSVGLHVARRPVRRRRRWWRRTGPRRPRRAGLRAPVRRRARAPARPPRR